MERQDDAASAHRGPGQAVQAAEAKSYEASGDESVPERHLQGRNMTDLTFPKVYHTAWSTAAKPIVDGLTR